MRKILILCEHNFYLQSIAILAVLKKGPRVVSAVWDLRNKIPHNSEVIRGDLQRPHLSHGGPQTVLEVSAVVYGGGHHVLHLLDQSGLRFRGDRVRGGEH